MTRDKGLIEKEGEVDWTEHGKSKTSGDMPKETSPWYKRTGIPPRPSPARLLFYSLGTIQPSKPPAIPSSQAPKPLRQAPWKHRPHSTISQKPFTPDMSQRRDTNPLLSHFLYFPMCIFFSEELDGGEPSQPWNHGSRALLRHAAFRYLTQLILHGRASFMLLSLRPARFSEPYTALANTNIAFPLFVWFNENKSQFNYYLVIIILHSLSPRKLTLMSFNVTNGLIIMCSLSSWALLMLL